MPALRRAPGARSLSAVFARHLMRVKAMVVTLAAGLAAGCGVSQTKSLAVRPPVQTAEVRTYGWGRWAGLGQEISVTLKPGVLPSSVVDLSLFAPFVPGMTQEQALAVAGPPARTWKDEYGQEWAEYGRAKAKVQIGCECSSSGTSVTTKCLWRLYALREAVRAETGVDPQLVGFVAAARAIPEKVEYRMLDINTADNSEFVTWPIETKGHSLRILWHDRNRSTIGGSCKVA